MSTHARLDRDRRAAPGRHAAGTSRARMTHGGFAMPAAIGALVIIGVLVTSGFYMARQELRIGVASNYTNMAVNIAQAGANEVMANWNGYQLGNVPIWGDTTITDTTAIGIWSVNITNTNNVIYYLNATGEVTLGGELWSGATRNVGLVTRLLFADIDPPAALTTRGAVTVKGTASIVGNDTAPAGWAGYCGPATNKAGVITDNAALVSTKGGGTIDGSPAWDEDPTLVDESFTQFGEMSWTDFVTLAQLEGKDLSSFGSTINGVSPAVDGSGFCNESVLSNWGDTIPSAPCGAYFPLMYHPGPLTIQSSGYGQGILLVDGDLDLRGGFSFHGIIIVQGNFETQGGGEKVVGAVMASNQINLDQDFTGGSSIEYSSCAVQRAILNNASLSRARPLEQRSWIDLSAVLN